jgi:hypothetical protein
MISVTAIIEMVDNEEDLFVIRSEIVNLIAHYLMRGREAKNTAALPHLINAIGSLTLYGYSPRQPIKIGLYTCLIDLEKAIAAIEDNQIPLPLRINNCEVINYDFLIEALQPLRNDTSSNAINAKRPKDIQPHVGMTDLVRQPVAYQFL